MSIKTTSLYQSLFNNGLIIILIYFDDLARDEFLDELGVVNDEAPLGCHIGTLKVGEDGEKDIEGLFFDLTRKCDVLVVVSSNSDYCYSLKTARAVARFAGLGVKTYRITALSNQGEQYTIERIADCNAITPKQAGKHLKYAISSGYGLSSFIPMSKHTKNEKKLNLYPKTATIDHENLVIMSERVLPIKVSQPKAKGVLTYIKVGLLSIVLIALTVSAINYFYQNLFQTNSKHILSKPIFNVFNPK